MNENILKYKKSRWELLGNVDVDGGMIIITDAENFPKYFDLPHYYDILTNPQGPENFKKLRDKYYPEMKGIDFIDQIDHDTCLKLNNYSAYSIPWLGGDGRFPLWGRFVTSDQKEQLTDLVIYADFDDFVDIIDFNITKECSIDIYSGKIGIDEPQELDKRGLVTPTYSYECPLGNRSYDIFDVEAIIIPYSIINQFTSERSNIDYPKLTKEEKIEFLTRILKKANESYSKTKRQLGTLIEINSDYKIKNDDLIDLLNQVHNTDLRKLVI